MHGKRKRERVGGNCTLCEVQRVDLEVIHFRIAQQPSSFGQGDPDWSSKSVVCIQGIEADVGGEVHEDLSARIGCPLIKSGSRCVTGVKSGRYKEVHGSSIVESFCQVESTGGSLLQVRIRRKDVAGQTVCRHRSICDPSRVHEYNGRSRSVAQDS